MESGIGKFIGSGGTATVYEWGNDQVIKVFKPNVPIEAVRNEEYIGRILNNSLANCKIVLFSRWICDFFLHNANDW